MKWKILAENSKGIFEEVDLPVYDDQFAIDGSQWGDEESNVITEYLLSLTEDDPDQRSFAATSST